jgi:hypothetical protein
VRVRAGATVIVALIAGGHVKNDTGVQTSARMVQIEPGQRLVVKW